MSVHSSSTTDLITFEHTWTIKNIKQLCSEHIVGQPELYSPTFIAPADKITTEDKKPVEFELSFCPFGYGVESRDFVGIYLELKNHSGLDIMLIQSIVMANGEKSFVGGGIHRYDITTNSAWGNIQMRRAELLDPANRFLSNDSLILHSEVSILVAEPDKPDLFDQLRDKYSQPEMVAKSIADLLDSGKYADVTFVMVHDDAGQELRAHKAILAARSRVFADMFESKMAESVTNRVEITESREVFQQVLRFIYTGTVLGTSLKGIVKDLLICADKFQLDPLKSICEEYLASSITLESNLSDLLELANLHDAHKLKAKVAELIRKKFEAQLQNVDKMLQLDRFLSNLANQQLD